MRAPRSSAYVAGGKHDRDERKVTMREFKPRQRHRRALTQRHANGLPISLLCDEPTDRLSVTVIRRPHR